MLKKFSIADLIYATNSIFTTETKTKNSINKLIHRKTGETNIQLDRPDNFNLDQKKIEKKLPLKIQSNYLSQSIPDFSIMLKDDVKSSIVNELYNLFKKKVKKGTLKIIIDKQLEAKSFKKKIDFLSTNINNLENHYKDLKNNLELVLKDRNLLETNNKILLDKYKRVSNYKDILEVDNHDFQKKLDVQFKNNELLKQKNYLLENNAETTNADKKLLAKDINNLHINLDRTIGEKNIAQSYNNDLKNILKISNENNKLLSSTSKNLHTYSLKIVKNYKLLEISNHNFQKKLNEQIKNNKLLTNEVNNYKDNKITDENINFTEITNNKLKYYQEENVRLSCELVSTQNRHNILKKNITKIETEKNNISNQIQELNNSLNNKNSSNIIKTPFLEDIPQEAVEDLKHMNKDEKKNLDDVINKIFDKI